VDREQLVDEARAHDAALAEAAERVGGQRLEAGCWQAHTPKGRPKPCFFLVMISSGRKPRSASLKNQRSFRPLSL
jgi:hypothetical protein